MKVVTIGQNIYILAWKRGIGATGVVPEASPPDASDKATQATATETESQINKSLRSSSRLDGRLGKPPAPVRAAGHHNSSN